MTYEVWQGCNNRLIFARAARRTLQLPWLRYLIANWGFCRRAGKVTFRVGSSGDIMKKPTRAARATAKPRAKPRMAVRMLSTAAPKGCCTIESPAAPDRQVPGITKAECDAIANAHPDTVTHWVEGACA
jgi:hypothetical protein